MIGAGGPAVCELEYIPRVYSGLTDSWVDSVAEANPVRKGDDHRAMKKGGQGHTDGGNTMGQLSSHGLRKTMD